MSWLTDLPDPLGLRERTMKVAVLPLGFANPLFYAFGAAAGAGVAWWTFTRLLRPTNLEAVLPLTRADARDLAAYPERIVEAVAVEVATPEPAPAPEAERPPEAGGGPQAEAAAAVATQLGPDWEPHAKPAPAADLPPGAEGGPQAEAADDLATQPDSDPAPEPEPVPEGDPEPETHPYEEPEPEPTRMEALADDLTAMIGIGPRTAAALMERGVTRFAHLAAWSEDQLAAFDAEMSLKGRSLRDAWLDQARRLSAAN